MTEEEIVRFFTVHPSNATDEESIRMIKLKLYVVVSLTPEIITLLKDNKPVAA